MGIEHILQNLDASELNIGYTPLIPAGLEYLNFFGGSAPMGRNLAPGKPQATVVGAPSVGSMAEGIRTRSMQDFIQTAVAHVNAMTIMAIAKADVEGEHFLVSNYTSSPGPNSNGMNATLRVRTDSSIAGSNRVNANSISSYKMAAGGNNVWGASSSPYDIGKFRSLAMRFDMTAVTGRTSLNDLTGGLLYTNSQGRPADSTPNIGDNFRIGSPTGKFNDDMKSPSILFVAMWSRVLSDAELATQYAMLKDFYATAKGVSV
ncbi:hypothetical protein I5U65_00485 [Stenotrophomonas maltophilia]|nr:hypothetical protein [Stenotrophomonas maltophilia]